MNRAFPTQFIRITFQKNNMYGLQATILSIVAYFEHNFIKNKFRYLIERNNKNTYGVSK